MQDMGIFCFIGCREAHGTYRLGKGHCNNLMYKKSSVKRSLMLDGAFSAPSPQVTGWGHREGLPAPVTLSSPSQQPPAAIPVATSPHLKIFASRIIKEGYFSVVSPLPLVKIPYNQGNQEVFTLSDLCSSILKH